MFKKYRVKMQFVERLCGSVPQNEEMIQPWLDSRKPTVRPPGAKSIVEVAEEVISTLPDQEAVNAETEKRITLGFQEYKGSLAMRGGTIKAHLKDCARILTQNYIGKIKGERSLAQRLLNCIMVEEYYIPILKDGEPVKKADGEFDKAIHVMTRMGPINALKRIQYIQEGSLTFHLLIMANTADRLVVSEDDLRSVFTYGAVKGYGGERGDGEGRYTFTIEEVSK